MALNKKFAILPTISALLLSSLACSINLGGPIYPDAPIPVSTEAVISLQEQLKSITDSGMQGSTVSITLNESQITSFLASKLQSHPNPLFTDPQVYLRDSQMQIYGRAHQGYFVANVGINVSVNVDENGLPMIDITSADFGPFPVPEGLKDTITAILTEAFTGTLGPIATGFRLESITITDGIMTVTGRIK